MKKVAGIALGLSLASSAFSASVTSVSFSARVEETKSVAHVIWKALDVTATPVESDNDRVRITEKKSGIFECTKTQNIQLEMLSFVECAIDSRIPETSVTHGSIDLKEVRGPAVEGRTEVKEVVRVDAGASLWILESIDDSSSRITCADYRTRPIGGIGDIGQPARRCEFTISNWTSVEFPPAQ